MPESEISNIAIGPWTSTLIALAAVGLVLADVGLIRRHRKRAWITSPQQLLERPVLAGATLWIAVPLALLAASAAIPHAGSGAAPLTAGVAALALLGAGHSGGVVPLSAAGLLLAGLAVAAVLRAWFGVQEAAGPIGLSLAALWMLWLAQFWKQQLLNGQAWTTAGRLIPVARLCVILLAGGMLLAALLGRLVPSAPAESSGWAASLGSGLQILLALACWRRALLDNNLACALAGGLAACAAALAPWIPSVDSLFLLALVAAASVLLARRADAEHAMRAAALPLIFLLIPCMGLLVALVAPWSGLSVLGLSLIGLAALGSIPTLGPGRPRIEPETTASDVH